jgi:signal transduction histidine kinase
MQSDPLINILLVDDRKENLLALEALLSPLGHRLVSVGSGEEALKCLLHDDFAVILLDVQMPAIDGFETAELIRGRERSSETPIIFLTAVNTSNLHVFRGYVAGAVDYLLKPIVPEILLSKVTVLVDLYKKTDRLRRQAAQLETTVGQLEHQIVECARTEEALRQARDELEQRVRERTAGLAAANDALRAEIAERERLEAQLIQAQKMESIGRLAGGIAHDFNNLLTAIAGYAELSLGTLPPEHEAHSDLQEIRKAADRATMLTRQLLTFARKQMIAPRVVDLGDLILGMENLLRRLIGEDIELIISPGAAPGCAKADPSQIEQLIMNLAVNARDAMPNGGTLTFKTESVVLDAAYACKHVDVAPGRYTLVTVSDTGIGMNRHTQQHLFEPFFTTKAPGIGTGLGLATCYGVVKQHGGHITCYSQVSQGTTFKIYFPCVDQAVDRPGDTCAERALPHGTERVLLVEDEAAVRMLAARVLRDLGYSILEATDGQQALELARANADASIQLLLTDVIMPQLSGGELARQLTALCPALKVLFISGYTDNYISHDCWLEPGTAFLQKPFSPAALGRKVREVLDS